MFEGIGLKFGKLCSSVNATDDGIELRTPKRSRENGLCYTGSVQRKNTRVSCSSVPTDNEELLCFCTSNITSALFSSSEQKFTDFDGTSMYQINVLLHRQKKSELDNN